MKKIYLVEVDFRENHLEDYFLTEIDEEIIKQDKFNFFTKGRIINCYQVNYFTSDEIDYNIKPNKISFVDDYGDIHHNYSLYFIYEDYEEAIIKAKKKIVRDIITLDIKEKLHQKAKELIHQVNELDAFMLHGIKSKN